MKNQVFSRKLHSIILVNIRSTHNVGSIFRTADGLGVQKIYLCGYTPDPIDRFGRPQKDIAKVALGAEQSILWMHCDTVTDAIAHARKDHLVIIGLEQDASALLVHHFMSNQSIALVLGEETQGLTEQEKKYCDQLIEIPMYGNKESFNVSVAFGIAGFIIAHGEEVME